MKNKRILIFSLLLLTGLLILSASTGWCSAESVAAGTPPLPADVSLKAGSLKDTFTKFGITMGGVIVSIVVIFAGLSIFKKLASKQQTTKAPLYKEGSTPPKSIDDAIVFFINKNRLR